MPDPTATAFLASARQRLAEYRRLGERALDQVDDEAFFHRLSAEVDPIAVTVKHVGGNLRSRWRDPLTTDGEKPDRHRDTEFVLAPEDTRDALMARWAEGWDLCLGALDALTEADVLATLTIRDEPHTVLDAVHRSLAHVAYHVGQIVLLAKHHAGEGWQTLSVPRGGTEAFNAGKREQARQRGAGPPPSP
jgi:hypothetical protein